MMQKKETDSTSIIVQKAEQTEIGHFVIHYFRAILLAIVLIIAGVSGYVGYRYWKNQQLVTAADAVFQFEKGSWKLYQENQLKKEELLKAWEKVSSQFAKSETIVPMGLEVAQNLIEKSQYEDALTILKPLSDNFQSNPYLDFFIGQYLGAVYDDLGKNDEAIQLFERLANSKVALLKPKIYFDLARICKRKGDNEKAKRYFQYIVDNFSNDPLAKMAKVYLKQF